MYSICKKNEGVTIIEYQKFMNARKTPVVVVLRWELVVSNTSLCNYP